MRETHGTRECYDAGGCRCRECTLAWRESKRGYEKQRYHRLVAKPIVKDGQHGTVKGYRSGCRCDRCKSAWRDYKRSGRRAAGIPERGKGVAVKRVRRVKKTQEAEASLEGPYGAWLRERGLT
jgi:hypothetical protein